MALANGLNQPSLFGNTNGFTDRWLDDSITTLLSSTSCITLVRANSAPSPKLRLVTNNDSVDAQNRNRLTSVMRVRHANQPPAPDVHESLAQAERTISSLIKRTQRQDEEIGSLHNSARRRDQDVALLTIEVEQLRREVLTYRKADEKRRQRRTKRRKNHSQRHEGRDDDSDREVEPVELIGETQRHSDGSGSSTARAA